MDRAVPAIIVAVVVVGLLALMWRSWRARSKRDASLEAGYPRPLIEARELASAPVFYVSTTPRDLPLERLAIRGLGFRARAELTVTESGVSLALIGEDAVFIPTQAIELLTPATWTIDRVVETDGLLLLGWRLSQPETAGALEPEAGLSVDSYFRINDPRDRDRISEAIRSIAAGAVSPTERDESEA